MGMKQAQIQTNLNTALIRFKGDMTKLFETLKENYKISKELQKLNVEYTDSKLGLWKFERRDLPGHCIYGENLWQFTKPKTTETVLLIPRKIGHEHHCGLCDKFHSYILVELVWFNINQGIKETIVDNDEVPYKETRMVPIYGDCYTLRKMLLVIQMYEGRAKERETPASMYLPQLKCGQNRPSGGL